jgi:hypothetical protein
MVTKYFTTLSSPPPGYLGLIPEFMDTYVSISVSGQNLLSPKMVPHINQRLIPFVFWDWTCKEIMDILFHYV